MSATSTTASAGSAAPLGGEWTRPSPDRAGYRRDAIVAAALTAGAIGSGLLFVGASDAEHAPVWVILLWAVFLAGPLAFRRRVPEVVSLVIAATFVIGQYSGVYETLFANICLFLAIYSVGAWGRNRMLATVVRVLITAGMLIWLLAVFAFQAINPGSRPGGDSTMSQFVAIGLISIITNLLYFGSAYVFGNAMWASARQRRLLEQRSLELEREREVSSLQAVALERVRIARELHDVVAHHVSVMGLQAGAARRMLAKSVPDSATGTAPAAPAPAPLDPRVVESLGAIESNAREAVDELHRMLATLRRSDDDEASRSTSTRGLAQLPELIEESRAGGLVVELDTVGASVAVPAVVGLSIYRITQESLTNVRKHAGARATAEVRLRYLPDAVELEITDTGVGRSLATPTSAHGLGHVGMRERVTAVGGTLEVGPKPRGGYRVRARLPLAPVSDPDSHESLSHPGTNR
ncbi:sensor histidine kinase [Herbiconiux sp.]|uniref:sensor histidine kinase n=1 Tax=Herbiconiux sp. TaxID=1871186 RepID=UPI0025BE7B9C|nr:sensor histidine kinase [Herbiconiux sp.]